MSFLRTDYSNIGGGFEPLPIGEYECIISEVKVDKSQSGYDMLKLTLTIRDDVPQHGQKRKFFDNVVAMEKTMWRFNAIAKAAGLPAGQEFATIGDFAKAIQYKPVRVKNKHEEYNGSKQDRIAYYMESKVQAPAGGAAAVDLFADPFAGGAAAVDPFADPFAGGSTTINISDEDLPF